MHAALTSIQARPFAVGLNHLLCKPLCAAVNHLPCSWVEDSGAGGLGIDMVRNARNQTCQCNENHHDRHDSQTVHTRSALLSEIEGAKGRQLGLLDTV